MERLEMTARQIQKVWESLRLEWLLCPLNLRNKQRRVRKGSSEAEIRRSNVSYTFNKKKLRGIKHVMQQKQNILILCKKEKNVFHLAPFL